MHRYPRGGGGALRLRLHAPYGSLMIDLGLLQIAVVHSAIILIDSSIHNSSPQMTHLLLQTPSGTLSAISHQPKLAWHQNRLQSYCLQLQLSWDDYQQVESEGWFYFQHELRHDFSNTEWLPDQVVSLNLILRPDLLSTLRQHLSPEADTDLHCLSQQDSAHTFLSTESWILLSAKQQCPEGEIAYRSFWDYLDWNTVSLNQNLDNFETCLLNGLAAFTKDTAQPSQAHLTTITTQLLETVLIDLSTAELQEAKPNLVKTIAYFFEEFLTHAEQLEPSEKTTPRSPQGILSQLIRFFQEEEWAFDQSTNQSVLHLLFSGKSGQWDCYAQAQDSQEQVLFYSVLPVKPSKKKLRSLAEFLSRVNYGLVVGNFELDFDKSIVRYKTSINLKGCLLNSTMLRQMVYANVLTVDQYFPGILQVIEGVNPAIAIALDG
jgi:hypothetical protein